MIEIMISVTEHLLEITEENEVKLQNKFNENPIKIFKTKIIISFWTGRQATMLKKLKGKMKRRNTEPTMTVATSGGPSMSLAVAPQENEETDTNNTDF